METKNPRTAIVGAACSRTTPANQPIQWKQKIPAPTKLCSKDAAPTVADRNVRDYADGGWGSVDWGAERGALPRWKGKAA
jgi:hypothetical protein